MEKSIEVKKEDLKHTLKQLKDEGFDIFVDLTAVDYIHETKVIYYLRHENLSRVRVAILVKREEEIESITDLWAGADWYERELFDLFGIHFKNHPDLKRILMPDDWVGHPLRKDYALTEEPVQFKHGVTPKVPSQIIPHLQSPGKNK